MWEFAGAAPFYSQLYASLFIATSPLRLDFEINSTALFGQLGNGRKKQLGRGGENGPEANKRRRQPIEGYCVSGRGEKGQSVRRWKADREKFKY